MKVSLHGQPIVDEIVVVGDVLGVHSISDVSLRGDWSVQLEVLKLESLELIKVNQQHWHWHACADTN